MGRRGVVLLVRSRSAVWWIGSSASLRHTLQIAQRFMPADQTLQFSDATGSLARGGRIGRLQWGRPGMEVTIENLRLDWSLREALRRDIRVRTLHATRVHVQLTPTPPKPDTPFVMPERIATL